MYEQINIFDVTMERFKIDKPIRLIELFAGVGSQAMALRDLGADFEHYRVVEFDKYAVRSYNAIFGTDFATADIRELRGQDLGITDTENYCYIMTYSFPCQDLSVAGRQKGMTKGSGTRSGLLWEVERLLNECSELPQVLLMENVTQVHSKENMQDFQEWIDFLTSKGYSNYWKDLNAKDYGVAQNRDRCFMVSLLGEWNYKFPKPIRLERKLKDYLEDEVDEKYYINTEKEKKLIQNLIENGKIDAASDFEMDGNFNQRGKVHGEESVCRTIIGSGHAGNEPKVLYFGVDLSINSMQKNEIGNCITAKDYGISDRKSIGNGVIVGSIYSGVSEEFQRGICHMARTVKGEQHDLSVVEKENRLGNIYGFDGGNYAGNVYDKELLGPTIRTFQGGNQQPMIVAMRGRNQDNPSDRTAGSPTEQRLEPNSQGICNTLTSVQKDNVVLENICINDRGFSEKEPQVSIGTVQTLRAETHGNLPKVIGTQYRIRKLTPLECWRLMGFSDEDFHRAEEENSSSQLYKQAGNSIVKNVLMAILGQMFQKG